MAKASPAPPVRGAATAAAVAAAAAAPPELTGDGLRLRPLDRADAELYLQLYTDAALMDDLGGALSPAAARRSFAIACTTGGTGCGVRRWWTIRDHDDGGLGLAGLEHDGRSGELGVIVGRRHQGIGVAGRALARLARHGFDDLGLVRLRIRHGADNPAMAALAAKLGFRRDDPGRPAPHWRWSRRPPPAPR